LATADSDSLHLLLEFWKKGSNPPSPFFFGKAKSVKLICQKKAELLRAEYQNLETADSLHLKFCNEKQVQFG
jgi:hypothetical protein